MTMILSDTILHNELNAIRDTPYNRVDYKLTAVINTPTGDIKIFKIHSVDMIRDYLAHTADVSFIEFELLKGDYIKDMYPHRANLELSIKYEALNKLGGIDETYPSNVTRYKAVFLSKGNKTAAGTDVNMLTKDDLNQHGTVTVNLQLLNRLAEPLRIKTTGGIFKNVLMSDVIKGIMGGESLKILIDGKPGLQAIDVVKPDNPDTKKHVIVPHGTRVLSVPTWLQTKMGGVYNSDIGTYLQSYKGLMTMFVYPLFNTKRFNTEVPRVVFFTTPKQQTSGIEKTFRTVDKTTFVLITGDKVYTDDGEAEYMDSGVGFRLTDARGFMKKPVELTKEGPIGNRQRLNTEVAVMDRLDGLNYLPIADVEISANPFVEYSKVQRRNGAKMDLVWENSDPSLLYPGMPCKVAHMQGTQVIQTDGVVLGVHALTQVVGTGSLRQLYKVNTVVSVFLDKLV